MTWKKHEYEKIGVHTLAQTDPTCELFCRCVSACVPFTVLVIAGVYELKPLPEIYQSQTKETVKGTLPAAETACWCGDDGLKWGYAVESEQEATKERNMNIQGIKWHKCSK